MATMIGNAIARRIASDWHGGQSSALYSLASTGRLTDADLPRAIREVQSDLDHRWDGLHAPDWDRYETLLTYLLDDADRRGIQR